ncbi:MAG TPA: class F sortase [Actinotalea sp.]|jgi:sortase (surface protein transpeptidase)
MSVTTRPAGRRRILATAAVVLACLGVMSFVVGLRGRPGPPQPSQDAAQLNAVATGRDLAAAPSPDAGPTAGPSAAPQQPSPDFGPIMDAAAPVRLTIPAIEVDTTALVPLTVGPDGVLPPPTDFATVGWHVRGPSPGQLGPAVLAAHVDGPDGPAVFYRLGELTAGDEVRIARDDGTVARFVIDAVNRYAKTDFPTSQVYGNTTGRAEIRLITCGGAFDRSTGHYVDNIVVFGHLVG